MYVWDGCMGWMYGMDVCIYIYMCVCGNAGRIIKGKYERESEREIS